MLVGHFSTALVAHRKLPGSSLAFLLIASQLQDILWAVFHYAGLEPTTPGDIFATTLQNMTVEMLYSHDLLPQVFWMAIVFVVGKLWCKSTPVAIAGAVLVLLHFIFDLISGHPHHVFGTDTVNISLGLYASSTYVAILIEAVITAITVSYFFMQESKLGIQRTSFNRWSIIGLFVFGILFMFFIATRSFRDWFGVPDFDPGFNTTIPNLIVTYAAMVFFLLYHVPKVKK